MTSNRRVAKPTDKETFSGRLVDLLNPCLDDIDIEDVARSLAQSSRYDGHTYAPFTIAQHSILVADLLPRRLRAYGLLHDAWEKWVGDIGTPMKRTLGALIGPQFNVALAALEGLFEPLLFEKCGLAPISAEDRAAVKRADLIARAIEQRDLMVGANDWRLPYPPSDLHSAFPVMSWGQSYGAYVAALADVGIIIPRRSAA